MKKYFTIIKTMWARALTYRFTIVAYRIGELVEILFLLVMWSALFVDRPVIGGYTFSEMITYVIVGNLITLATRNFLSDFMAREIKDGTLSLFVVKPLTYFRYAVARELGRVTMPFVLSLLTQVFVIALFIRQLIVPPSSMIVLLFLAMVVLAFILELFLAYLVGTIAFWTDEVDGIYTTISRLKRFISGGYFPLSLLPAAYVQISMALPFAYSFFVPTQLYLGKISIQEGLVGIGIQLLWIVLLYGIIKLVWRRGVRRYEGVGI